MITLISRSYGNNKDVMLSVRVKNDNLNTAVALGISVSPSRWHAISETIKQAKKAYRRDTSIFIDDALASKLWSLIKVLMNNDKANTLTLQLIKSKVREILHTGEMEAAVEARMSLRAKLAAKQNQKPHFIEFVIQYRTELETGKRLKHRSTAHVSQTYIDNITSLYNHLVAYQDTNNMYLDWEDLTLSFFNRFKAYLLSKKLTTNTVVTYLNRLRTILRDAKKLHYTANDDFNISDWYPENEEVDNVYVTTERIMQLYNAPLDNQKWLFEQIDKLPLTDNEKEGEKGFFKFKKHRQWLMDARDIFVVGCLTGQRYSDYIRISTEMYYHIGNRTFIHLKQEKTGKEVYIPLNPIIDTILKRNDGHIPFMQRAKLTRDIRICGMFLGWNEPVTVHISQGNMTFTKQIPFCDMLKSHTCRRSFATNAYRANIPLSAIMTVTGHSSEEMLRRYLKLSTKERAILAAKEFEKFQGA